MIEPESAIDRVVESLVALASNPPFRFRDTPKRLAERYLQDLRTFQGYSDEQIDAAERALGLRFPRPYRAFLKRMGVARGLLFRGSDVADLDELAGFRADALELLRENGTAEDVLRSDSLVFLFHQGYSFLFFSCSGEDEPPVLRYVEGEHSASPAASSLVELLEEEAQLIRSTHESQHTRGGYWLTVFEGGGASESHPALSSGERPLDGPHRFW